MMIGMGAFCGLLAWPVFKFGVAMMFGLTGVSLVMQLTSGWNQLASYSPWFAGVSFLVFALLGWFLLKAAVIIFTAGEGSVMIVLSLFILVSRAGLDLRNIPWINLDRPGVINLAILVLAILGILYQLGLSERQAGEKK